MSQQDDTLKERLSQHLNNLEKVNERKGWLRDLVEWLVQELGDDESSAFPLMQSYRSVITFQRTQTGG